MSDESIIGGRRNVRKRDEFDVIGPKRDAKKVRRDKVRDIEIRVAAPRSRLEKEGKEEREEKTPTRRQRSAKTTSRGWILFVLATLIMIAATMAVFLSQERYQHNGLLLLAEPLFTDGFEGWTQGGSVAFEPNGTGQVTFRNDDPESRAFLKRTIALPPGMTLAHLEATISTEGVVAGEQLWQRARIYLVQLDQRGEALWKEPHNLFTYQGTRPAELVRKVFPIPESIEQATLSLELNNATGAMTISDLKLYPVEERPAFRQMAIGLMVAWAGLALLTAFRVFSSITSIGVRVALGGMLIVLIAGLFMPAPLRNSLFEALPLSFADQIGIEPDMIGHGIVFAIMAFLVRIGLPRNSFWLHLACWILVAIATEILQLFTFDRETSIVDFMVDGVGFLLGLTLGQLMRKPIFGSAVLARS